MNDSRRPLVVGGIALVMSMIVARRSAIAQLIPVIPVYDGARFLQMLEMLRQVEQLTNQIAAGLTTLRQASQRLGGGPLEDIILGYRYLAADLANVSYRIDTVTQQFRSVFPDETAVRNTPSEDVAGMSQAWDGEIHHAALAASRAHTTLSQIERNTHVASTLLERSQSSTEPGQGSELAALQAVVQMIGIINNDLGVLATTLATTERVNAALAATESSEREVDLEQRRRLLENYSGRGASRNRIDERFLR